MSTIAVDSIEPKTSGGAVLFPNRPAFKCRGYGSMLASQVVNGVTVHSNSSIIYNWDSVDINRGSAFDNTTGRYTVPVAGLYRVECGFGYKAATNYLGFQLFLTSDDDTVYGNVATWAFNDGQHTGRHIGTIVEASVGQEFACGISTAYTTPETSTYYSWFSGYLIG